MSPSVIAIAAILALASYGAAGTNQASCTAAGAHTLAADRVARAFSLRGSVYGCIYATGKPQKLGGTGFCRSCRSYRWCCAEVAPSAGSPRPTRS